MNKKKRSETFLLWTCIMIEIIYSILWATNHKDRALLYENVQTFFIPRIFHTIVLLPHSKIIKWFIVYLALKMITNSFRLRILPSALIDLFGDSDVCLLFAWKNDAHDNNTME